MTAPNMFHNASVKLSGLYLIIIMVISLLFSLNAYNSYSSEIDSTINRPLPQSIRRLSITDLQDLVKDRQEFANEAKDRYRNSLIVVNGLIVIVGGLLSYYLARRTLKPIEKAHEAQGRFTADASHELRTPIAAMRIENELALSDTKLSLKDAKKQLESNIEELDKLTSLSEGLLKMARVGENGLERKSQSISHVIELAIKRVSKKISQKSQIIDSSKISSLNVLVNKESLVEAIVTLLENAINFSPEKSKISISTKTHSKSIDIVVQDSGVGIEKSALPHIFDRFYRADNSRAKTQSSGYGIGLSIAKSVAEAHGGSIAVKSKEGKGATFTIILPL